jgi:plasmid stability protein
MLSSACTTHDNVLKRMGTLVQIRDLPDHVHRTLKARAAASGVSLSEYLRALLARAAERPTPEELAARIRARGAAMLDEPSDRAVRRLRDAGE